LDDIVCAVRALVVEMGGSISAEHGMGCMKREELVHVKSDAALDLMRRIKVAFDARGILSPGKMV
jgi:FAD/FMN-containing dehydrogenase